MAQAVQKATRPKFRGRDTLKSKVQTRYPQNLEREYRRITNAYMKMLEKILAEHLPKIKKAIAAGHECMRHDEATSVYQTIDQVFLDINAEFERRSEFFELSRKLLKLSEQARIRSIREWKRVVQKALGINILEDYYTGEFFREALKLWAQTNVSLIKANPSRLRKWMVRTNEIPAKTNPSNPPGQHQAGRHLLH